MRWLIQSTDTFMEGYTYNQAKNVITTGTLLNRQTQGLIQNNFNKQLLLTKNY